VHPNERRALILERVGWRMTIADYMRRIASMQAQIKEINAKLGDGGLDTVMAIGEPLQRVYDAGQNEKPPA
jgi:hypothetical protein